jgi:hypothetical protein
MARAAKSRRPRQSNAGRAQSDLETRSPPEAALSDVASVFTAAADIAGGTLVERYSIAGTSVALEFASTSMWAALTPALAHLAVPPDAETTAPTLTVRLWDSASTGLPAPPRPAEREGPAGAILHAYEPPRRMVYQPGLEALSVFDEDAAEAWHWVADVSAQPDWNLASPVRQILFWWLSRHGCLQLHGAAVGKTPGGVLIVGKGGSGKSTVALACLGTDLLYAADDYVGVTLEPSPRIHSLYSSGKLDARELQTRLPRLLPLVANPDRLDREKAIVYVDEHFPDQTTLGFPLRAVLVPAICAGRRESRISETSRLSAFTALAPSTIFQLHTAGREALSAMSRLVETVPCFGLELGSDVRGIPHVIRGLLSSLEADEP